MVVLLLGGLPMVAAAAEIQVFCPGAVRAEVTDLAKEVAGEIKGKSRLFPGGPVGLAKVAAGEIELGVAQVSEIAENPKVTLAGPLPAPLQNILTFSAGLLTKSSSPEAARQFIRYLTSPAAKAKFKAGGFEVSN